MSPGARLAAILVERKLGKSEFARMVTARDPQKRPCAYHNVHRWTRDHEFTAANQERAARALDIPLDYFASPVEADEREQETRETFERFLRTPAAKLLTPAQVEVLRSMRFLDRKLRPTVAFYDAVAANLRGLIREDEILSVAEVNAALDESLSHKPPLKRR